MKRSTNKTSAVKASTKKASVKKATQPAASHFDIELVKQYTDFMKANDLVEIDLRNGEQEIRLRRNESTGSGPSQPVLNVAPSAVPATVAEAPRRFHVVCSPFVGTFYRTPGPNQDAFVDEGKTVNIGDTLCIVEAMKLMNEIESEVKGRIVKILVNNGTPVEFGEALFEIDPL